MTGRTALALSLTVYVLVLAAVLGTLSLLGADPDLLALAYIVVLLAGSYAVSRVATRYFLSED
jgi:hypothetical protein